MAFVTLIFNIFVLWINLCCYASGHRQFHLPVLGGKKRVGLGLDRGTEPLVKFLFICLEMAFCCISVTVAAGSDSRL